MTIFDETCKNCVRIEGTCKTCLNAQRKVMRQLEHEFFEERHNEPEFNKFEDEKTKLDEIEKLKYTTNEWDYNLTEQKIENVKKYFERIKKYCDAMFMILKRAKKWKLKIIYLDNYLYASNLSDCSLSVCKKLDTIKFIIQEHNSYIRRKQEEKKREQEEKIKRIKTIQNNLEIENETSLSCCKYLF